MGRGISKPTIEILQGDFSLLYLIGYSPIALAKNSLGLSLACEDFGSSFFANGATPSGVLEYPNTVKDPEKVRDAWRRAYGSGNRHKIAVLEQGMKYQSISIPNNEAQFLEPESFRWRKSPECTECRFI